MPLATDPTGEQIDMSNFRLPSWKEWGEALINNLTQITGRNYSLDEKGNLIPGELNPYIQGDQEADKLINTVASFDHPKAFLVPQMNASIKFATANGEKGQDFNIRMDFGDKVTSSNPEILQSTSWGMVLIHELAHNTVGYGLIDPPTTALKSREAGETVEFVNAIRQRMGLPTKTINGAFPTSRKNRMFYKFSRTVTNKMGKKNTGTHPCLYTSEYR